MKICLLGASFDTCNMGVSALAESSIKCIHHRWPQAEIVLLGNSRSGSSHCFLIEGKKVWVRDVPLRISKNIFLPNHIFVLFFYAFILNILPFQSVREFLKRNNSYLALMLETDIFADITGGDSFSDIYGARRFIFGFLKKLLPVLFGKKFILLPQTYGPFKNSFVKIMARYILKNASMILSRDQEDADYVCCLLPGYATQNKVRVVPDVAFVLDSQKPAKMDVGSLFTSRTDKSIIVGLNISGLLYYYGYTNSNMFGLKEDYSQTIRLIVDLLLAKEDVFILLIPHVFPLFEKVENDVAACLEIKQEYSKRYTDRIFMVQGVYDQCQIKYIIGLCNFFLGSRMHSCIAALSLGIPTVGLAYSKKFSGVFGSIGINDQVIDLRYEGSDSVLASINRIFFEREAIAQRLSETIPKVQEAALKILDEI